MCECEGRSWNYLLFYICNIKQTEREVVPIFLSCVLLLFFDFYFFCYSWFTIFCQFLLYSKVTLFSKMTMLHKRTEANETFSNQSEEQTCMIFIIKCKLLCVLFLRVNTFFLFLFFLGVNIFFIKCRRSPLHHHVKFKVWIISTLRIVTLLQTIIQSWFYFV